MTPRRDVENYASVLCSPADLRKQVFERRFVLRVTSSSRTAQPTQGGCAWGSLDFRTCSEYHDDMSPTTFRTTTRRSSDLSKHSAEVFAEAEDHPVTVTRRDGEDFVLMSQREAEGRVRLLEFTAQLIGVSVDDDGPLAVRMSRVFPWMLALPPEDRATCAQDLVDAARASFSTGQPYMALTELTSWRETATAIAAGLVRTVPDCLDADADADALADALASTTYVYATVYRNVLFPYLDGHADRFFDEVDVIGTRSDRKALDHLRRCGAVIEWGGRLSLAQPHKALMLFAASELTRPERLRWSSPEACDSLLGSSLIPGAAPAVMKHFGLEINSISDPPETIWHGTGPEEFSIQAQPEWVPWIADGLTDSVPLAVAYADLFCVSDWRADAFADYVLRRVMPRDD